VVPDPGHSPRLPRPGRLLAPSRGFHPDAYPHRPFDHNPAGHGRGRTGWRSPKPTRRDRGPRCARPRMPRLDGPTNCVTELSAAFRDDDDPLVSGLLKWQHRSTPAEVRRRIHDSRASCGDCSRHGPALCGCRPARRARRPSAADGLRLGSRRQRSSIKAWGLHRQRVLEVADRICRSPRDQGGARSRRGEGPSSCPAGLGARSWSRLEAQPIGVRVTPAASCGHWALHLISQPGRPRMGPPHLATAGATSRTDSLGRSSRNRNSDREAALLAAHAVVAVGDRPPQVLLE
jgi:hypothetical protein